MNSMLLFDPASHQLTGPTGSLDIAPQDWLARRFLMLLEGQCLHQNKTEVAEKYGLSRPRYYQLLDAFRQGGLTALQPQKTGPKSNYRRTDQAVRQVLRHLFLDPDASAQVVAQKLRQTQFSISLRSVQRIIADYGLQKKTLRTQPLQKASGAPALHPGHAHRPPAGRRRPAERRTPGSSTPGR
jgi:transposase